MWIFASNQGPAVVFVGERATYLSAVIVHQCAVRFVVVCSISPISLLLFAAAV
jgi:hypothetical protein